MAARRTWPTDRLPALLALALPVGVGLAYQATHGAPRSYLAIDGIALALALCWLAWGSTAPALRHPRIAAGIALALFALPLATGPELNHITRWLPLGPFALHAGMLVLPLLLRLAAEDREAAPLFLVTGVLVAFLQPDAASAAALTFGAVGLHHVGRDWRLAIVAILGFAVTIHASLHGELPPQPFVERVLHDAARASIAAALGLFAALAASFALILFKAPQPQEARFAIAGGLFGFAIMAQLNVYPAPLIGYGASPILGFALALAPSIALGRGGGRPWG